MMDAVSSLAPQWLIHDGALRPASAAALARQLRECGAEVVVAIGGGTVMDAAKAAAYLSGVPDVDAATVVAACEAGFRPPPSRMPLVAVPTTPGSGAEVTPFATIWQPERNRKLSLAGPGLAPAAAILDPDLLHGLSRGHLAAGLLDTLCQGAEAAWSVRSTAESESYGLAAVRLAGAMLGSLDGSRLSDAARYTLQLAGNLSGHAIACATTSSCHALSYPLTLRAGLAHGHACGITLGQMLRYNAAVTRADCADPRGPGRVRDVVGRIITKLGAVGPEDAEWRITAFLRRNGLATLQDVPCSLELVVRDAVSYPRIADNPRALTAGSLLEQLGGQPDRERLCG
jgi:alcohol dehydrogenase class IV